MRFFILLLSLVLFPVTTFAVELNPYPDNITVTVTPLKSKFDTSDDILVQVKFTNSSDNDVRFLVWGTPFEGRINADFFNIQLEDGSTIPYSGRMYKRGVPTESDYKTLQPGETIAIKVNLLDGYKLKKAGNYSLQYSNKGKLNKNNDAANRQSAISYFTLEDTGVSRDFKRTPNYSSCSSSQQSYLDSALSKAEQLSQKAKEDLQNTPVVFRQNASRSNEWFGSYSESRYSKVTANFDKIYSVTNRETMGFDCSCNDPYYAYVYPDEPYNVYLCSAFWGAPLTGTDSKAGTLIHEISHFYVVAGTDDHVYGQTGARDLADSSPNSAIDNADNYEYFAENTPYLSMPTTVSIYQAVDNSFLSWKTGGHQAFFGQENTSFYDGDAAQSGSIDNSQYSYLQTSLPYSSKITFTWKVSSESDNDYLEFRVDDEIIDRISGETGWLQKSYTLRGEKTVEWRYVKDSSVSDGSDAGWVDQVIIEELPDVLISPVLPILLNNEE